jgi:hypothetical protein
MGTDFDMIMIDVGLCHTSILSHESGAQQMRITQFPERSVNPSFLTTGAPKTFFLDLATTCANVAILK